MTSSELSCLLGLQRSEGMSLEEASSAEAVDIKRFECCSSFCQK